VPQWEKADNLPQTRAFSRKILNRYSRAGSDVSCEAKSITSTKEKRKMLKSLKSVGVNLAAFLLGSALMVGLPLTVSADHHGGGEKKHTEEVKEHAREKSEKGKSAYGEKKERGEKGYKDHKKDKDYKKDKKSE
jgi:hypothetical protein